MIRNLIFDIGNVITTEVEAAAFTHLDKSQQNELTDIVIFDKRFTDVLLGKLTTAEYRNQLLRENSQHQEEISALLDKDAQSRFIPRNPQMVELIYSLKDRYKIYFLSDMIDITYTYLKDLLEDFDGGVYSYQEHLKKPDARFFQVLLDRYNLKPSETIFFDDKLRNVETARKLGISAEVFINKNTVLDAQEKYN